MIPEMMILMKVFCPINSPLSGPLSMMSFSGPSSPRDCAGGPSMIILIQRSCIGVKGVGIGKSEPAVIVRIAAMFVVNWNLRNLFKLS